MHLKGSTLQFIKKKSEGRGNGELLGEHKLLKSTLAKFHNICFLNVDINTVLTRDKEFRRGKIYVLTFSWRGLMWWLNFATTRSFPNAQESR